MTNAKHLVSFVALLALVILSVTSVSAFATIQNVEVNGVATNDIAAFAGETLSVRVTFVADDDAEDVRVKAWLAGESDLAVSSGRFDVIDGSLYTKVMNVGMPSNIDPAEDFSLWVVIENRNDGIGDSEEITVNAQRESYVVQVLDVNMDTRVRAGDNLAFDIVLKNRGRHLAEDTFVRIKIPALGISERAYFGDLSAVDQSDPDKEDAVERRMNVYIPMNTAPGIYDVEIRTFNADSDATVLRKVAIVGGARESTIVASAVNSKTFAVGEEGVYSLTIVNTGDNIRVYRLALDSSDKELNVDVDEPFVVVPAGTSKTVKVRASASEAGIYGFSVNVYSGSELANKYDFSAKVKGSKGFASSSDAAVLLTVILAIIFVVLLVVLIVLLTRNHREPRNSEKATTKFSF